MQITVNLTDAEAKALRQRTGQRTAAAALRALITQPPEADAPQLNAATRKSMRSKSTRGDQVFKTPDAFKTYLTARYK